MNLLILLLFFLDDYDEGRSILLNLSWILPRVEIFQLFGSWVFWALEFSYGYLGYLTQGKTLIIAYCVIWWIQEEHESKVS